MSGWLIFGQDGVQIPPELSFAQARMFIHDAKYWLDLGDGLKNELNKLWALDRA